MQEAQAQEVQFISYLSEQDFLSYSNDLLCGEFHFWDKNKFMSIYGNYCEWQQKLKATHVKYRQASVIHQPMPQAFLIFPLLPVGGMMTIDGGPQSYKTDVALSLAFAVAFNRKIFDRYETGQMGASSGNVLYLYGDNHQSTLSTKLM